MPTPLFSTIEDAIHFMDTWTYHIASFVHQFSDIQHHANYQRTLCQESTLYVCSHLCNAFYEQQSYTLGQLTTLVSGYKADEATASEHKAAQGRIKTILDALQAYRLITVDVMATSSHATIQYRIVAQARLQQFFEHAFMVYRQAA